MRRVRALWAAAGMRIETLSAMEHDRVFALVSHLPHVAAFALVRTVAEAGGAQRALTYAAGGFRDSTRVAGSSPEMWTDVFLANRRAMIGAIDRFIASCMQIRTAIVEEDSRTLERVHAHRERLILHIEGIIAEQGPARSFRSEWQAVFRDKLMATSGDPTVQILGDVAQAHGS